MAFDPKRYVIKVQGNREYLPVSARLIWFRGEHPDWGIVTTAVEINLTPENGRRPYAIFQAQIFNAEGRLMATATKMEDERGFPDFLEKAETGSVGRALALCGYGTQFAPELEIGDSHGGGNRYPGNYAARPNAPGNGAARPQQTAPPPQNRPDNRPAPAPPPVSAPVVDDEPYEPPTPRAAAPAPANGNIPAPRSVPEGRVAPTGTPIQRVREPEPDDLPMPDDDDEGEDPFADEEDPAPRAAAPRPVAARSSASVPVEAASNQCAAEGCTALLTPAQLTMSLNKFGKPLCLAHQKDNVPAGAGAGASGRRNTRPSGGDTLL